MNKRYSLLHYGLQRYWMALLEVRDKFWLANYIFKTKLKQYKSTLNKRISQ